jgi:hypothetical protein
VKECVVGGFCERSIKYNRYGEYSGVSVERSGEKGGKKVISKSQHFLDFPIFDLVVLSFRAGRLDMS